MPEKTFHKGIFGIAFYDHGEEIFYFSDLSPLKLLEKITWFIALKYQPKKVI